MLLLVRGILTRCGMKCGRFGDLFYTDRTVRNDPGIFQVRVGEEMVVIREG